MNNQIICRRTGHGIAALLGGGQCKCETDASCCIPSSLIERLCQSLAFHLIESEITLSHAKGDTSPWTEECGKARGLIKEAGFDIDVLYPILDRPTCTEPQ
jgi:hypothetical protein